LGVRGEIVGRTVREGRLSALSDSEASIESNVRLGPLSNLKIELARPTEGNLGSEIYTKMIGAVDNAHGQTRIRFTSVSSDLKLWLQRLVPH
jgi:hypothetical protein